MSSPTTITVGSRAIDLAAFRSADVDIVDIARALSHLCRFTGHTSRFYSVAEHAVRCSVLVPEGYALEALLHDAHEAYIGDISTPMKCAVPALAELEARIETEVRARFELSLAMSPMVRRVDRHMLVIEARELLGAELGTPDPEFIIPRTRDFGWSPTFARNAFVARFSHLLRVEQSAC
jgi:uncharacterized protein